MICAGCNRAVHSRYTLALGKTWHTYHFTCYICRVVLGAEDYRETPGGVTCADCSKVNRHDGGNDQLDGASENTQQTKLDEEETSKEDKLHETQATSPQGEVDMQSMYSDSFYKRSSYRPNNWLEDRIPTSVSVDNLSSYSTSSEFNTDTQSESQSDSSSFNTQDSKSDTDNKGGATAGSNTDDSGAFSSEFYKRSYYYRKTLSLDSVDSPEPPKPVTKTTLNRTPQPSPTTGPRGIRLSKYGKTQLKTEPSVPYSFYSEPKQFSESFYKRPHNPNNDKNRKFDFEYRDNSAPQPTEHVEHTFPTPDPEPEPEPEQNPLYKLIDDQAYMSATLLDTSDDMKARSRFTGIRRPPPSMSIRVVVPTPVSHMRKSDPPAPTSSPSPPLSLPSSPSPPPVLFDGRTLPTPPVSPQLVKKPQQNTPYANTPQLQVPPMHAAALSRSGSPPLSLPAVPSKDITTTQQIVAKIEEQVVRSVMEDMRLGKNSDIEKNYNITSGGGGSSSSLLARKRRLKQTHREATLQRQLSLHKHLVNEVVTSNAGAKLRKVTTGARSKSSRQELIDSIRCFPITALRKAKRMEYMSAHTYHLRDIKNFTKNDRRLKQVVGNTTATALLPTMTNLVWKGKNCTGATFRDVQFLLRDPVASKDLSSRLALRYRGSTISQGSAQIGEVDCIVAIPHEAAISFAARLSVCLRVPLQILQQKPIKAINNAKSQAKATVNFLSGRGLYAAGVETLQSRTGEEYELWLTQRNCIRSNARVVVIDDVLDNGSPLVAAMKVIRAAGAQVIEMVAIVEYQGFGGREKISQTCQNIGLVPHPLVHTCLVYNDN